MSIPKIFSNNYKVSKTGHHIPVVNDIHLHSIYNPIKEAQSLTKSFHKIIETKPNILVFGLAFAYHINEISSQCRKIWQDNFQIVVIEPNEQIAIECLKRNLVNNQSVKIFYGKTIQELYQNMSLIHFLLNGPGILPHPASFNLYSDYFKNFLKYNAPDQVNHYISLIKNQDIKNYLTESFHSDDSFEIIINKINNKTSIKHNEFDYLLLTLNEIDSLNTITKDQP